MSLRPGTRLRLKIDSSLGEGNYVRADSAWIYLDVGTCEVRAARGKLEDVWEQ